MCETLLRKPERLCTRRLKTYGKTGKTTMSPPIKLQIHGHTISLSLLRQWNFVPKEESIMKRVNEDKKALRYGSDGDDVKYRFRATKAVVSFLAISYVWGPCEHNCFDFCKSNNQAISL